MTRPTRAMTTSDLWDAETAERYDESSAFMFTPEVLDPTVDALAGCRRVAPPSSWRSEPGGSPSPSSTAAWR